MAVPKRFKFKKKKKIFKQNKFYTNYNNYDFLLCLKRSEKQWLYNNGFLLLP